MQTNIGHKRDADPPWILDEMVYGRTMSAADVDSPVKVAKAADVFGGVRDRNLS